MASTTTAGVPGAQADIIAIFFNGITKEPWFFLKGIPLNMTGDEVKTYIGRTGYAGPSPDQYNIFCPDGTPITSGATLEAQGLTSRNYIKVVPIV